MQHIPRHLMVTGMFIVSTLVTFLLVMVPLYVENEKTAYMIVLSLCVLFGIDYALLQASLYGFAGPSADLMNNINLGTGISQLAVNLLRMVVLASVKSNEVGAQIFFYTAAVYLIFCTYLAWRFISDYEKHLDDGSLIEYNQVNPSVLTNLPPELEEKTRA